MGPCYDWCKVKYKKDNDEDDLCIAKIIAIFSFTFSSQPQNPCQGLLVHFCQGLLVHYTTARDDSMEQYNTLLQTSWRLCYERDDRINNKMKPFIEMIGYESVQEKVFVVEECPGVWESPPNDINRVIEITQRSSWSNILLSSQW